MRIVDAEALESIIQEQTGKCMIKIFDPSVNLILQDIRNAPTIMSEVFLGWLYWQVQRQICKRFEDCNACPFRNPEKSQKSCNGLTVDQKLEILMKIFESEVDAN